MATDPYTLEHFIADVDRIAREDVSPHRITERVAPLLARLVATPGCLPAEHRRRPATDRGRHMLHRAPHFNVTSVVWGPGDTAAAHDHGAWGVIGVIDNEIEETRYRVTPAGPARAALEVTGVFRHGAGAVSRLVPGDEVHRMHNPTQRDTIEIHVYGKDLVGLRRTTWTDDGSEKPFVSRPYLNC